MNKMAESPCKGKWAWTGVINSISKKIMLLLSKKLGSQSFISKFNQERPENVFSEKSILIINDPFKSFIFSKTAPFPVFTISILYICLVITYLLWYFNYLHRNYNYLQLNIYFMALLEGSMFENSTIVVFLSTHTCNASSQIFYYFKRAFPFFSIYVSYAYLFKSVS